MGEVDDEIDGTLTAAAAAAAAVTEEFTLENSNNVRRAKLGRRSLMVSGLGKRCGTDCRDCKARFI
jgi:hypothetical protein